MGLCLDANDYEKAGLVSKTIFGAQAVVFQKSIGLIQAGSSSVT
jgi:hypothetical protein